MSEAAGVSRPESGKPLYKYVYELPYLIRKQVCRFLDVNDDWKELAGAHMGYSVFDILVSLEIFCLYKYELLTLLKFVFPEITIKEKVWIILTQ